jgi:hypothetical protein
MGENLVRKKFCSGFDADPDPDPTFHYDVDPDPTLSFTHVGNFFFKYGLLVIAGPSLFIFLAQRQSCRNLQYLCSLE